MVRFKKSKFRVGYFGDNSRVIETRLTEMSPPNFTLFSEFLIFERH